jgi:hypothetical protein
MKTRIILDTEKLRKALIKNGYYVGYGNIDYKGTSRYFDFKIPLENDAKLRSILAKYKLKVSGIGNSINIRYFGDIGGGYIFVSFINENIKPGETYTLKYEAPNYKILKQIKETSQ